MLFPVETFNKVVAGETVACGKLFPGMSDEDIEWEFEIILDSNRWLTRAYFMGVYVGKYQVWRNTKGSVSFLRMAT